MSLGKGSSGGGGTNTVTQVSQPPQQFLQAYQQLMKRANQAADTPLQGYGGAMVAGFNPEQQTSFQNTNQAAGAAKPYINQAATYAGLGAKGVFPQVQDFSGANVNEYYSPYQQDVINSTMANVDRSNQIQQNQLLGSAIGSGNAFGGDRAGVAAAELARTQDLARGQTLSGLENQGYSQALGELNNQQQLQLQGLSADAARKMQAAGTYGGLGAEAQQTGLAGASAQMQVGGMQQQLQQEMLNIPYEQFLQQQAYPFQTTGFLAPMVENLGAGAGGSSSTTGPAPNAFSQIAGLGLTGLGAIGSTGGFGSNGWLTSLLGLGAGAAGGDAAALGAAGVTAGGGITDLLGAGLGLGLGLKRGGRAGYDGGGAVPGGDAASTPQGPASSDYNALSPTVLQQLAMAYPAASAAGQAIRKALMAKMSDPSSSAPTVPVAPTAPTFGGPSTPPPQHMAFGGIPSSRLTSPSMGLEDPGSGADPFGGVEIPMPDVPSSDYSSDAYESGSSAGAYAPPGHPQHPFNHHLPKVMKISSPVPDTGLAADTSATHPHGGLGIPQPPAQLEGSSSSPDGQSADAALSTGEQIGQTINPDAGAGGGASSYGPTDPNEKMGGVLDSPWLGVAEAGLATMGGTSPFAAVNIGRGGLTGIQGAITQQQQKVEIGLKRAEAEKSQADADMQRMLVKAQGIAMRGMEGAVDSSGGGGGSGVTDVSARSGGGSSAQGVMAYAPYAGTLMNQAAYMARFPQLKGMSEYLEKQAEADPLFIRGQEMIKKGLMPQPDGQGGFNWVMPSNTREQFQQLSLLGPQAADKPTIMYGPNGDPQRIIWSSVGADGKTTQNVVPYTPEAATAAGIDGGSGNGGGGQQDARPQVQPWADASAHMPVETFGKKYAPVFDQAEQKYQLTPGLLPAMAWTESHFNPNAISPKGAEGPLQFMPQTAKDYDVNARDVGSSINGAGHMMSDLLTKYHGNATRALAAYNWGAGHVDKWVKGGADISRLPPETQRYILSVRAAMEPGAEPPGIAGGAPAPSGGGTTVTVDGKPAPTGGTGVTTADPYATTKATQEAQTVGNYTGKFGTESETANVANNRIDQMLAESHTWNPGKPAEYWGNMKSWLAPLYPNSEALQKSVADQAQFNKNVGALQRDVTSSLGSGIASSEFDAVGKTLINQGMTRRTVVGMAMQFKGLQDFQIARNLAWANKDALMPDVTDKQFMGKFQQEAGPAAFVLMEAHHAALGGDADAQATYDTIKNSLLKTAEGRATLKHISQQVQWIEDNNLFQQPGPQ